jgi:nucleotide-binding universal stress UspA family protein
MKIVLAVDGSEHTKRMLGYVAAHDEMFGTRHDYVAVTVVAPIPPHVTHYVARSVVDDFQRSEADAVLGPVRAFAAQKGWALRAQQVVGHPAEAIAALAREERADLLVVGSHGHGAFAGLVLGSVATGVIARSEVPVLLIR